MNNLNASKLADSILNFYSQLTARELLAIYNQNAVLGYSAEQGFLLSLGSITNSGDHQWLEQRNMVYVDIGVVEAFCNDEGQPPEDEPEASEILACLEHSLGGVLIDLEEAIEQDAQRANWDE